MEDKTSSYLPSESEKLPHKAILDAIARRRREVAELQLEASSEPEPAAVGTEIAEAVTPNPVDDADGEELDVEGDLEEESGECTAPEKPEAVEEISASPPAPSMAPPLDLPQGKAYFRIGEASDLLGVEPHVLRYWESEFPMIRPTKSGGQRVYRRKDMETLHEIRHLLHVEGLGIRRTRRVLRERRRAQAVQRAQAVEKPEPTLALPSALLKEVAQELRALIRLAQS